MQRNGSQALFGGGLLLLLGFLAGSVAGIAFGQPSLGSILGAVVAGFLVGLVEAYGQGYAGQFSQVLIFVLMAAVILVRPAGLFGREEAA